MINRLFIIILGIIMRKKILVCATFVFLKCVTNEFKYYSNKIIPKNKSVNYNFFFFLVKKILKKFVVSNEFVVFKKFIPKSIPILRRNEPKRRNPFRWIYH